MSGYETILVGRDGPVAVVTLNRPDRMNAWTIRMAIELNHAFLSLEDDDDVRAIVVTGAGRAFCAGADIDVDANPFGPAALQHPGELARAIGVRSARPSWTWRTPIIGALNGHAVGVGITMPLLWDIRIAAEDAKISFVFTRRGVVAEMNTTWMLPRLIGVSRAMELLLTGRTISGTEAAEIGLVSRALPRDEVLPAAVEIARDIAANTAPAAVGITKRLVNRFLLTHDREEAWELEMEAFLWCARSPDAVEGVMSFLEKRPPNWTGTKHSGVPGLD